MTIIEYKPTLDIRNIWYLPRGTGCRYLICLKGQENELIAKHWARNKPKELEKNEVLIKF